MEQITLGQRIAERRKMLGLSQEALGEKLGVSRQAISKWESDGAVPEIEKLIGLSKLFSVSVGWLLGTEENVVPKQSEGFSEEQLKMVEEIVKRYQPPRPEEPRKHWMFQLLTGGAVLVALILAIAALIKVNNPNVPDYQSQLSNLTSNYANLQSDIGYLSNQLDELAQGEKLLLEYDFEATVLEDLSGARIQFTAVPNTWQDGDWAVLSIRLEGSEVAKADCVWDGAGLVAYTALPAANDYAYYFALYHADGTQEQQVLEASRYDHYAVDVKEGLGYDVQISPAYQISFGQWTMRNYAAEIALPMLLGTDETLAWEYADLVLLHNGKEIARSSILEAEEYVEYSKDGIAEEAVRRTYPSPVDGANPDMEYFLYKDNVQVNWVLKDLQADDVIILQVQLKLNNGMTYEETVETLNMWEFFDN